MKIKLLLLLTISGSILAASCARRTSTTESVAIQNVKSEIRTFQAMNGDRLPNSWEQLSPTLLDSLNEKTLKGTSGYPLQNHYVFVKERIPMLGFRDGEVLLIRTSPVKSSGGKRGRYIISRYNGELQFRFYKEEEVRQMLAQAGITSGVLLQPEASYSSYLWWAIAAPALLLAAGAGYYFLRRGRKGSAPQTAESRRKCDKQANS